MAKAKYLRPYWLSWYWTKDAGSFELYSPWWVTGSREDGARTVCAAIIARDEEHAKKLVCESFDTPPADITWRFCERQPSNFCPFSGRFPRAPWMHWST
ncbi:hypothetical protein [Hydrocarboniphaga sp.]|uniref:hypothetical protein n=1 Tax=Hydrocarboniphaga sp. TaxID=2033016 RepID=UPI003D12282D